MIIKIRNNKIELIGDEGGDEKLKNKALINWRASSDGMEILDDSIRIWFSLL